MLISISDNIYGYRILEYKKIVFGVAKSSEGADYRDIAITRIQESATKCGANAIINLNLKFFATASGSQEVTAYGLAIIADPIEGMINVTDNRQKVDISAYTYRKKSPIAKVHEANGIRFVVCPECGTKYKVEVDENGNNFIKGFKDIDDKEPGIQIKCVRCNTQFTVPEK